MTLRSLLLAASVICAANAPAFAFDPVGAPDFNTEGALA
jgi:hypothetical protein